MSALDTWKALNRHDVTLPSGTAVTISLPDITECIAAGGIPIDIIARIEEADDDYAPTTEDLQVLVEYHRALVAGSVVAVEGEEVTLSPSDVAALPREDIDAILGYARRIAPLPKAA